MLSSSPATVRSNPDLVPADEDAPGGRPCASSHPSQGPGAPTPAPAPRPGRAADRTAGHLLPPSSLMDVLNLPLSPMSEVVSSATTAVRGAERREGGTVPASKSAPARAQQAAALLRLLWEEETAAPGDVHSGWAVLLGSPSHCAAPPHTTFWGAYRQPQQVLGRGPPPCRRGGGSFHPAHRPPSSPAREGVPGVGWGAGPCASGRPCSRAHTQRACPVPRPLACVTVSHTRAPGPAQRQLPGTRELSGSLWNCGKPPGVGVPGFKSQLSTFPVSDPGRGSEAQQPHAQHRGTQCGGVTSCRLRGTSSQLLWACRLAFLIQAPPLQLCVPVGCPPAPALPAARPVGQHPSLPARGAQPPAGAELGSDRGLWGALGPCAGILQAGSHHFSSGTRRPEHEAGATSHYSGLRALGLPSGPLPPWPHQLPAPTGRARSPGSAPGHGGAGPVCRVASRARQVSSYAASSPTNSVPTAAWPRGCQVALR